jgi:hypothetical protein
MQLQGKRAEGKETARNEKLRMKSCGQQEDYGLVGFV